MKVEFAFFLVYLKMGFTCIFGSFLCTLRGIYLSVCTFKISSETTEVFVNAFH